MTPQNHGTTLRKHNHQQLRIVQCKSNQNLNQTKTVVNTNNIPKGEIKTERGTPPLQIIWGASFGALVVAKDLFQNTKLGRCN